jgi:branched-chain amino acid transport system substrate-binding protein
VSDFKAEFKHEPAALTALGYDAAMVLFDAIERAKTTEGKALAAAIAQTRDFHGVTGTFTLDSHRNAKKPMVILEMKGGKPVYRKTIEAPK